VAEGCCRVPTGQGQQVPATPLPVQAWMRVLLREFSSALEAVGASSSSGLLSSLAFRLPGRQRVGAVGGSIPRCPPKSWDWDEEDSV